MSALNTLLPADLMSTTKASNYLGTSICSIRRWIASDADPLPYYKVGGRIRISQGELKNWVLRRSGRGEQQA